MKNKPEDLSQSNMLIKLIDNFEFYFDDDLHTKTTVSFGTGSTCSC